MITLRPRIVMKKTTQLPLGRMAHERLVHLLYASWSAGRLPRHLVQFSGDLLDGDHEVAHVDRSDVTVPLVEEGVERPTASVWKSYSRRHCPRTRNLRYDDGDGANCCGGQFDSTKNERRSRGIGILEYTRPCIGPAKCKVPGPRTFVDDTTDKGIARRIGVNENLVQGCRWGLVSSHHPLAREARKVYPNVYYARHTDNQSGKGGLADVRRGHRRRGAFGEDHLP